MKKLLRTTKFPEEFETKVSMSKVKLDVMLPWISQKITQYLGFEDEVVVGYVEATLRAFFLSPSPRLLFSVLRLLSSFAVPLLRRSVPFVQSQLQGDKVDPKQMQLYLTGFLEKHTSTFMKELWALLLSAQESPLGIPSEFLEKKKEEIRLKKEEQERIAIALKAKRDEVERQVALTKQSRAGHAESLEREAGAEGQGGNVSSADLRRDDYSRDDRDRRDSYRSRRSDYEYYHRHDSHHSSRHDDYDRDRRHRDRGDRERDRDRDRRDRDRRDRDRDRDWHRDRDRDRDRRDRERDREGVAAESHHPERGDDAGIVDKPESE